MYAYTCVCVRAFEKSCEYFSFFYTFSSRPLSPSTFFTNKLNLLWVVIKFYVAIKLRLRRLLLLRMCLCHTAFGWSGNILWQQMFLFWRILPDVFLYATTLAQRFPPNLARTLKCLLVKLNFPVTKTQKQHRHTHRKRIVQRMFIFMEKGQWGSQSLSHSVTGSLCVHVVISSMPK